MEIRSRNRIMDAPAVVLLFLDISQLDPYSDEARSRGEEIMGVQSVALAGGTLMLAAHAEGLGSVWMCAPLFVPEIIQMALELPAHWIAQGMVLLGFPEDLPDRKPRKPLEDLALFF